jgi:ferredoxin-NADP reductase
LALTATAHLSMLVVRRHRSRPVGGDVLILLPALLFAVLTWVFPQLAWNAAAVAAHLLWFTFCEKQFPPPPRTVAIPAVRVPARAGSAQVSPRAVAAPAAPEIHRTAPSRGPVAVPVLAVFQETPDVRTFRIQRPDEFDFCAGQFLTVRVQVDGKAVQRAYSISSAPLARGYLEISVKRIGLVSGVLHSSLRPGSMLTVRPPAGTFVYPGGDDRPLILLAGGIGITPLMSMLRHAIATQPSRPVALIYSVRTAEDLAFRDELALVSRRHPQVRIGICVSKGPASDRWHLGHITGPVVRAYASEFPHALACICGPQAMMAAMTELMVSLGVPSNQIRSESFGAAMKLVTSEAAHAVANAAPRGPAPAAAAAAAMTASAKTATALAEVPAGAARVRFARTGCEGLASPMETLLEAAEANGVAIPSSCRAGVCHTCITRVLEGDVECDADLDDEERAGGFVLPCVSHVRSDCVLEA